MYPIENRQLNDSYLLSVKRTVLAALAYFDLFDYPLTAAEIFTFLEGRTDQRGLYAALPQMVLEKSIYCFDQFYALRNDDQLAMRRQIGNRKAAGQISIAERAGRLLIRFPFVRGVAISGSLSKNYADEYSDIDFFIITAKNRLWIARTLMHIFKKFTFLVNRQDHYCMNYYVDEQGMEIAEKNIYTAIEIATLIPLQGDHTFEQFFTANSWVQKYLPNKIMRLSTANTVKHSYSIRVFESLLNNAFGDWLDNLLMRMTAYRWDKKTIAGRVDAKGSIMQMKTEKHCSKPDPVNFQSKLLRRYEYRLATVLHMKNETVN